MISAIVAIGRFNLIANNFASESLIRSSIIIPVIDSTIPCFMSIACA